MQSNTLFLPAWTMASFATFFSRLQSALRTRARGRNTVIALRGGLLLLTALMAGCGGGPSASNIGAQRKTGRLQVVVKWPDYQPSAVASGSSAGSKHTGASGGRLIPLNATRIDIKVVDLTQNSIDPKGFQTFSVTRTSPTHTFVLPTGDTTVSVTEFDGASPVTLQAQLTKTIVADQDTLFPIAPQTNIAQIEVQATSQRLVVGATSQVTATAYTSDASGKSVVPVALSAFTFDSGAGSPVSVTTQNNVATVTAVHADTVDANVTAKLMLSASDSDPTFSKSVSIHVVPRITLSPKPATVAVSTSPQTQNQITFTAQVVDGLPVTTGVTWSVVDSNGQPASNGGTIIPVGSLPSGGFFTGIYTSPNARGTFYVRATSSLDNTAYDQATVQVLGGGANVTVN